MILKNIYIQYIYVKSDVAHIIHGLHGHFIQLQGTSENPRWIVVLPLRTHHSPKRRSRSRRTRGENRGRRSSRRRFGTDPRRLWVLISRHLHCLSLIFLKMLWVPKNNSRSESFPTNAIEFISKLSISLYIICKQQSFHWSLVKRWGFYYIK